MFGRLSYLNIFVGVLAIMAVFANYFLVYIITSCRNSRVGRFKWMMASFAVFEAFFAIVIVFVMPEFYIGHKRWVVFSNGGLLSGTSFAWLFNADFYCFIALVYCGFVVLHFVLRYLELAQHTWSEAIFRRMDLKTFIISVILLFVGYTAVCAYYFCARERFSDDVAQVLREHFGIADTDKLDYFLLSVLDKDSKISFPGSMVIIDHYMYTILATIFVFFLAHRCYAAINRLQSMANSDRAIHRQVLLTLIIQASIPVAFVHVPKFIYATTTFFDVSPALNNLSPAIAILTVLNKLIDPIIVLLCVGEYKTKAKKFFGIGPARISSSSPPESF